MFFVLSKVAWFVLVPSTFLALVTGAGLVLATVSRRRGLVAVPAACACLALLIGLGPPGGWLLLPLEDRFPAPAEDGPIAGIVVLGGGVESGITAARGQLTLGGAGERVVAMADLARRHPDARVVFSGGSGEMAGEEMPEADAVARYGGVLGIDPSRITFERSSRTTWENARNTRALLGDEAPRGRWLLVTSARHMPRAVGCFRQVGFPVTAYPVDYLTAGVEDLRVIEPSFARGWLRVDEAAKEWVGLVAYRLSGRTDALFPAP